nr:autotransporter assembly complex family protein [uncultured Cohaesibacter sp.]
MSRLTYHAELKSSAQTRLVRKRDSSLLALCLASTLLSAGWASPAAAFELFGYDISTSGIKAVSETQPTDDIPDPVSYTVTLTSDDEELTDELKDVSLLIEKEEEPASGTTGLLMRARSDQKRLIAALYEKGLYGGTVDITVNGERYDRVPLDEELSKAGPVTVAISVSKGPVFTFSKPDARLSDGEPIDLGEYGVITGSPAYSQLVLDAEEGLVADYKKRGFALAKIEERSLAADHKTGKLDVTLRVDHGPRARLGQVTVTGNEDVKRELIIQQANIPVGDTYSPEAITKASRNLRALGVFDSVIVKPADALLEDGSLPIEISVKERKFRTIGAGVTIGNLDGVGLEGYWVHRNLFGGAESLRLQGSIAKIGQDDVKDLDYNADIIFKKPGVIGPASTFDAKLSLNFTNPEAYQKRAIGGEVGLSYQWTDELSTRAGLKAEYARIMDSSGTDTNLLFSTPLELAYDKRDSKLDPTEGFYALIDAEPTISSDGSIGFVKTSATLSAYQSLDRAKRFVLAGKISAGTIVGASKSDVPTDRRFFTGGGGSIRGYSYQMAGPRDASNDPTGGRSYIAGSLEARMKVTDSIGLAAFVDVGNTFNSSMPKFGDEWYTGVGAGLRYLTPIGPLRLDVAVPLKKIQNEPKFGVYLGLGQAF